ncbi:putative fasciclin-like arabinogalactan protein 20 [Nicotiana tabacum]|uniref:Fasciclin-like arabinogalactan protein 20 n=1 Tax=Nicotiana tabacum TaxID=4097 RepID=A0A1S4D7K8_TOBAC|nr:PREDICTED: putative fasciclin-like arabinogalactan protein 20 [Nicotiana tabacum]
MAASFNPLSFFIIFSSLLSFSTSQTTAPPPPPPPQSLLNAAETLSNSGYVSMSLTLELISDTILSRATKHSLSPSALTIFTPPDSSFVNFGQPSLSHLLLHFSPLSLSLSSLQSLPFLSKIPSLSPSSSLYITSLATDLQISINNVKIVGSPIYDDGYVVVFAIEDFFSQNFTRPTTNQNPNFKSSPQCITFDPFSRFYEVSLMLKSKGYLIMASFLELQLIGFLKINNDSPPLKLTVFAPMDDAIVGYAGDFSDYQQLFLRHLVPCVWYWTDLNNGTEIKNYVNGFNMMIKKVNDVAFVNGVEITYPDLYYNDWLVVHGLQSVIPLPDEIDEEMGENFGMGESNNAVNFDVSMAPDHSEF